MKNLKSNLSSIVAVITYLLMANQAIAQNRNWIYFSGDDPSKCTQGCVAQYIDPFSKASYGFEKIGMLTLTEFDEASQSAQTFGYSEVQLVIFDCINSRMNYGPSTWYSGKQAQGKVTKEFKANNTWAPIQRSYIPLFSKLCGP